MATATLPETEEKTTPDEEPSKYLKYLPGIYREDEFMGRFLKIFESILTPIDQVIAHIHQYFDPKMAPGELLPWLASWVDLVLDESWPLEKRRKLIGSAVELYQLRGTRRGLSEYLRIYTGVEPTIVEHFGGIKLGEHSELGLNTILGDGQDHSVTVILEVEDPSAVDLEKVVAIVEAEKPAHVGYDLTIVGQG
jgi:phage tail-like protein